MFIELHLMGEGARVTVNTDKIITVEGTDIGCVVNLQDTDNLVVEESYKKVRNMLHPKTMWVRSGPLVCDDLAQNISLTEGGSPGNES